MSWEDVIGHYNYWVVIVLMMIGFYVVIARGNLIKKIVGLNIFQTSVFLLYISMGKVEGGTAPILVSDEVAAASPVIYTNPLPSVLILTAIVVGIATSALALALVVRIKEEYGTIEEDEVLAIDLQRRTDEDAEMAALTAAADAAESKAGGHH